MAKQRRRSYQGGPDNSSVAGETDGRKRATRRLRAMFLLAVQVAAGVVLSLTAAVLSYQALRGVFGGSARVLDLAVAGAVYRWRNPCLTTAMTMATSLGATVPMAGSILLLVPLAWRRHRQEVVTFVIIFAMGVLLNLLIKAVIRQPRPGISPLIEVAGYSYPSGHAMNSLVFYSAVAFLCRRLTGRRMLRLLAAVLAAGVILLIGFTRVYLGVHYPSDVVAGYVVGALWLAAALLTARSGALAQVLGSGAQDAVRPDSSRTRESGRPNA